MGKVAAGSLNKRITFQKKLALRDTLGQPLPDQWDDHVTVWGNVRTMVGTRYAEFITANTEVSRGAASIRIRKRSDLTADMRAICSGRIYDILAILPDEEGDEYLDVVAEFGGNAG